MTTFDWPADCPNPTSARRRLVSNTKTFTSPLTGATQTASRPGERWEYILQWQAVTGAKRGNLLAALARLNGAEHRQRLPVFAHRQTGALTGTPLINGAGQTGAVISIKGAPNSVANWIRRGDLIAWDNGIKMATADAASNGSGIVSVSIMPKIRFSPANNAPVAVTAAAVLGVFILADLSEWSDEDVLASGDLVSSLTATFSEDVLA